MKTKGLTELLFIASFIMLALISVKVIENRDKKITNLEAKLVDYDRLLRVDQMQDSLIEAMPSYVPQGWEIDSMGVYNLNNK